MQEQRKLDTRKFKNIIATTKPFHFNIIDFKIVQGHRYYKITWRANDDVLSCKWQSLEHLSDHMDVVYQYQKKNKFKIRQIQDQWVQYFIDGKVKKPYVYLDLKKMKDQFEDNHHAQDDSKDSSFQIANKRAIRKGLKFMITPNIKSKRKKQLSKAKTRIIKKIQSRKHQDVINNSSEEMQDQVLSQSQSQSLSESYDVSAISSVFSEEKQSFAQFGSNKQSQSYSVYIQPRKKQQPLPETIEVSKKRQQIMKICHEAIQKGVLAMQKDKSQMIKQQPDVALQSWMQEEKQGTIVQKLSAKQISIVSLKDQQEKQQSFKIPDNIFTPEQSLNLHNSQMQLQYNISDSNELRSSNIRQYLKNKFPSINIDLRKGSTPEHSNSQIRHSQNLSIIQSSYQRVRKARKQAKTNIQVADLLRNIQTNTRRTDYSADERYISSNLIPYESTSRDIPPNILKINHHFTYHNLILYSISVGNLYSNRQMFALHATLHKINPTLLQCYSIDH